MPPYEEYIDAIRPLWDSHRLTNMGQYHQKLEDELREYLSVPELSLMVNGHMALEMVIQAMGFKEGTEIITTPFTFISTTHAIVRNRLKPVFCDVKPDDGTIDETKIENLITEKTGAILPVHVYGNVCNVEKIQQIAEKYGLKVIYDAAHAFGVKYNGNGIGSYGDAAVFSFHATKVFNTIEGGAVTFSDSKLYDKLYNLKNFGIRGEERVVSVGANAKMNEFSAIMGLCNLKHIAAEIEKRKECWIYYYKKLKDIKGITILKNDTGVDSNYAYFPILVEDNYRMCRNELYELLKEHEIFTRKYFYPITAVQECYGNSYLKNEVMVAKSLADKVLALPIYAGLERESINRILEFIC